MVNILPKYTGWADKLEADKPKPRLIMRFTVAEAQAMGLADLETLCANYDLALNLRGTHYEARLKE